MDSKTIILDSSVWVAFCNDKDSQHEMALKYEDEIEKIQILPDFIFQETATVLKYKDNPSSASFFVEIVSNNESIRVVSLLDEYHMEFVREFLNPENKDLSFIDASLLALHKTGKFKVITFDINLQKLISKNKSK